MANSKLDTKDPANVLEHAATLNSAAAAALAKVHIERIASGASQAGDLVQMGLYARGNADYRKELDAHADVAKGAKEAMTLGAPMSKGDWSQARDLAGGSSGRVYLPKILTDYAGKIVMVTDTHVVQQVSKTAVVAHDRSKLNDSPDFSRENIANIQNKNLKVSYGVDVGKAEVLTFTQVRAAEVQKTALAYAEQAIKTPAARATFMKHVEKMMAGEIERSKTQNASAPQPARAQQREQERAR